MGASCRLGFVLLAAMLGASGCALPIVSARREASAGSREPRGRAHKPGLSARRRADEGTLDPAHCYARLAAAGVAFEPVARDSASGIAEPTRLLGTLGGVAVVPRDHDARHGLLDCRLALALLSWAPTLRHAGIDRIEHYSTYRPGARVGGSRRVSGHARGMAIDAARFHLADGEMLDVSTDWEDREHGTAPCPLRQHEGRPSRLLRGVVCAAVDRELFQVVLTPHHDRAHANHVHLELKPEVSWVYVR